MKLVERHIIYKTHPEWKTIDHLCFLSKNLYNYSVYKIREHFKKTGKFMYYNKIEKELRTTKNENYIILPNNSSQQILLVIDRNFRSFFQALRRWKRNKTNFTGCPKPPKFKHKTKGRNLVIFTINQVKLKDGFIKFPKKTNLKPLKTKVDNINQVRIIPQTSCYVIEVVYEKEEIKHENLNEHLYLGIDLGINNIVSMISNQPGLKPILINGQIIKSYNQYFNKTKAKIQSNLEKNHKRKTSNKLNRLQLKRNNKIDFYLHHVSKFIVEYCTTNDIGNIIIGKNDGWKQNINIGKVNNQKFVSIPYEKLIQQIEYKSKLNGIKIISHEESYTSKCSSLDIEEVKKHDKYIGKRIYRGLFKYSKGLINADTNAALNILRKVIGDTFIQDFLKSPNRGFVHNPVKVNPLQRIQLKTSTNLYRF